MRCAAFALTLSAKDRTAERARPEGAGVIANPLVLADGWVSRIIRVEQDGPPRQGGPGFEPSWREASESGSRTSGSSPAVMASAACWSRSAHGGGPRTCARDFGTTWKGGTRPDTGACRMRACKSTGRPGSAGLGCSDTGAAAAV